MDNARPPRKPERPRYLGHASSSSRSRRPELCGRQVEGRGTPNDSYFIFQEPFGVPAVRSGAALSGFTLAPRVRIAPERSAFYRPRASALVGGRVSVPDLASVELSALPGQTRPAFSRSASSL